MKQESKQRNTKVLSVFIYLINVGYFCNSEDNTVHKHSVLLFVFVNAYIHKRRYSPS